MCKIISVVFMTLILFSCKNRTKDTNISPSEKISNQNMNNLNSSEKYYTQKKQINYKKLRGFLTLKFDEDFKIKSTSNGFVKEIYTSEGKFINKGQTIAVIEVEKLVDLQEEYLITKNLISKKTDQLQNSIYEEHESQKISSELDLLNIRKKAIEQKLLIYNINPTVINVNNIQKLVKIIAPASGIITSLNLAKEDYITESIEIGSIEKNSDNYLKIKVSEDELRLIKKGQKIQAFSTNNPDKQIQLIGRISNINKESNEDGTYNVYAKIIANESSKFSEHIHYNINFEFDVLLKHSNVSANFNSDKYKSL